MKQNIFIRKTFQRWAAIGWLCASTGFAAHAQALPPELQEVVKLSQQHINDDVIISYVKNSGRTFQLSADEIISLNNQGVSQSVINALQPGPSTAPVPPQSLPSPVLAPQPPSAPPAVDESAVPPAPTMDYFQAQLAPYGSWVNVPGYGLCWKPVVDFGWRPYYDQGHWEYTDAGWYWQSDYPWGDIAFHYGRWTYTSAGWAWVPGYEYAPAWVVWRHADADGFIGWAALPPGAIFVDGGWRFNGIRVGADFDFHLGVNFFAFVGFDHFWEHDFRRFVVPHDRLDFIFHHSVIEGRYHFDHGRFINDGLARDRMAALTHHEIRAASMRDLREHEEHRNVVARRDDIHDFRPGAKPDGRRLVDPKYSKPFNGGHDANGPKTSGDRGDERTQSRGSFQEDGKGRGSDPR